MYLSSSLKLFESNYNKISENYKLSKMSVGNVLSRGVFVVAAKRTPFGTFGGSLKAHTPTDLQVIASNAAMQSIGLKPENIDSVVIGNVLNASSPDAPYLARHVALKCGLPVPTPAYIGKKKNEIRYISWNGCLIKL